MKIIDIKELNKGYKRGNSSIEVLKDIDLEIHEGEYTAIMGKSGSGKSTLMNIIVLHTSSSS